jgi:alpha-tubulin suppressor-like RCC1 family protein
MRKSFLLVSATLLLFVFGCEELAGIEELDGRPKRPSSPGDNGNGPTDPNNPQGTSGQPSPNGGNPVDPNTPKPGSLALSQPHRLALGSTHSCAIVGEKVQCWGSNASGQLGKGAEPNGATGRIIPGVDHVVSITSGAAHTCAIDSAGAVACWGRSEHGQLGGKPTETGAIVKVDLGAGQRARQLAAGTLHTCALVDQSVKCWGDNAYGQLGDNTRTAANAGTTVSPIGLDGTVAAVYAAGFFTCALKTNGALACWGDNNFGQIGDRTKSTRPTPVAVLDVGEKEQFKVAGLGQNTSCGVTTGGSLYCWGRNRSATDSAPLGIVAPFRSAAAEFLSPTAVGVAAQGAPQQLLLIDSIAVGPNHACARSISGNAICWGSNAKLQLGIAAINNNNNNPGSDAGAGVEGFIDIGELQGAVKEVAVGLNHSCALLPNDAVYCWGASDYGQAGGASVGAPPRSKPERVVMKEGVSP